MRRHFSSSIWRTHTRLFAITIILVGIVYCISEPFTYVWLFNHSPSQEIITIKGKKFVYDTDHTNHYVHINQKWLVMSQDNTYQIDVRGLYAAPNVAVILEVGKKYKVETIGCEMKFFGEYKRITKIIEEYETNKDGL